MDTQHEIINRVAGSGLMQLDLEELIAGQPAAVVDIADYLYMGLILREADFRQAINGQDWSAYSGQTVGIHCSADAVVPMWAYMLLANALQPHAAHLIFGDASDVRQAMMLRALDMLDLDEYSGKRVVVKGCGDAPVSPAAYIAATRKLAPVVKSLMFGEPCSTVPIMKAPKPTA